MSVEWRHESEESQRISLAIEQINELREECSLASNWVQADEQDDALELLYRNMGEILDNLDRFEFSPHFVNKWFAMDEEEITGLFETIEEIRREYARIMGRNQKRKRN